QSQLQGEAMRVFRSASSERPRRPGAWNMVLLATLIIPVTAPAADWPQFLGPARNGISMETGLLQTWPKGGPAVVWSEAVGAGFSGPVVAGERLIVFHRIDNQEIVSCLNAATGSPVWKFSYPTAYRDDFGFDEGPRATPLVGGGHV